MHTYHAYIHTYPYTHLPTYLPTYLQPTALWGVGRRPYPTGAWWINLVLEKGENNVGVLPYAIKASNENGIEVGR